MSCQLTIPVRIGYARKKNKTKQPSHLHFLLSHIYWFISHYFSSLAAYPLSWLREALSLQMKHVAFSLLLKGKGSETGCSELGWWKGPAVLTVINVSFRCQGTLWIYIKAEKMSSIMNGFSVLFSIFQSHTSLKANLIFPKKSNVLVLWMFWNCRSCNCRSWCCRFWYCWFWSTWIQHFLPKQITFCFTIILH